MRSLLTIRRARPQSRARALKQRLQVVVRVVSPRGQPQCRWWLHRSARSAPVSALLPAVSLARALLKKPSLLILDEASSALDAETERRIQENLLSTGSGRATIAVAHRLSTIRNANEILAMVDGAIVERGKHDELLEHQGVYSSQWTIQTGDMAGM